MRTGEWMRLGRGVVSGGQTTWGWRAGWWVGLKPETLGAPEGWKQVGVGSSAWSSLPDSAAAPRGSFLWSQWARHAQNCFLGQALMPNPLITHCQAPLLTSDIIQADIPRAAAWEFIQLQNQWLWFAHHLDCDPEVSQAMASNYRMECMNGFFD